MGGGARGASPPLSVSHTLIFGMLDVVNLTHGSYYMLGVPARLSLIATGSFWLALLVAPPAVTLIRAIVERACLRPVYRRGPGALCHGDGA